MSTIKIKCLVTAGFIAGCATSSWAADEAGSKVEKCSKSFGALAVSEPQHHWGHLRGYGLGSPAALLRMMIQQSGCFDVVERGVAMQNLKQERDLAQDGEMRQESNVGKGQMQAADFVLTPDVQISSSNSGGVGAAVGGVLDRITGGRLPGVGGVTGGLKFKEAGTSILIADVRSSIQVASAEGKASKTDFSIGGWGFGGGAAGAASGYTNTPEGKVIAASLLDNYNNIVIQIRDKPQLIKQSSAAGDANAAASTQAGAPQKAGEMLAAKINNVKVFAEPSKDSQVLATLKRTDELIATGEVKNGFVKVDAADFSGWVQRTLVSPSGR